MFSTPQGVPKDPHEVIYGTNKNIKLKAVANINWMSNNN
jgi:hypothetical protein